MCALQWAGIYFVAWSLAEDNVLSPKWRTRQQQQQQHDQGQQVQQQQQQQHYKQHQMALQVPDNQLRHKQAQQIAACPMQLSLGEVPTVVSLPHSLSLSFSPSLSVARSLAVECLQLKAQLPLCDIVLVLLLSDIYHNKLYRTHNYKTN